MVSKYYCLILLKNLLKEKYCFSAGKNLADVNVIFESTWRVFDLITTTWRPNYFQFLCRETCQRMAGDNERLHNSLYQTEKDTIEVVTYLKQGDVEKDEKVYCLCCCCLSCCFTLILIYDFILLSLMQYWYRF